VPYPPCWYFAAPISGSGDGESPFESLCSIMKSVHKCNRRIQPSSLQSKTLACVTKPLLASVAVALAVCGTMPTARAELIWWDGTRDTATAPLGKLLSDNEGYWGEVVLTGVDYRYEVAPDIPADTIKEDKATFGRRLLDGQAKGNWWIPVGTVNRPLVAIFDFKRACTFTEVDLATRSNAVATKVEVAENADGPWRVVYERPLADAPDRNFHRLRLPHPEGGRYLRLTVEKPGETFLDEVWVWGDAEVSEKIPESIQPVAPVPILTGASFTSIPGIDKSAFSDAQFAAWQRSLGEMAQKPAVWSQAPTWDSISAQPILPSRSRIGQPVSVAMARNETEAAALTLTNTSMVDPAAGTVTLSPFKRIGGGSSKSPQLAAQLRVGGAIQTRWFGANIGPLFSADNMPGKSLMNRYLTNAPGIQDFPKVTLSPAGSVVIWVSVQSKGAEPGIYEASLSYTANTAAKTVETIPVRIEVLPVTLPNTPIWLQTWSGSTEMLPFTYADRQQREVAYKQSLGITVWNDLPVPGSDAELARRNGGAQFQVGIIPVKYRDGGYNGQIKPENLTADDEKAITEHVQGVVKHARELGLNYSDWYGELWDEPGATNAATFAAIARIVRKADPKVRIYINPCYWSGNGVMSDEQVDGTLGAWYRDLVDVSVPLENLLFARPQSYKSFDAPHSVRAFYTVSSHGTKGEQAAHIERYARFGWDTFKRGWDGWGFYAYYASRGNPWTDLDGEEKLPDYSLVYPGPRGPIPTRQSESVREGTEAFRLLTLIKQQGKQAALSGILKAYSAEEPLAQLRLRALRLAAQPVRETPKKVTPPAVGSKVTAKKTSPATTSKKPK
jgi:hypothetical protein